MRWEGYRARMQPQRAFRDKIVTKTRRVVFCLSPPPRMMSRSWMPSPDESSEAASPEAAKPTFWEATRYWFRLGCLSFGGPAGQIAIMHTDLVERKRWISEERFLHALNFCMLLPGPEAQQLATYIGWRLHGTAGGVAAGALFVLPAALLLWALSWLYAAAGVGTGDRGGVLRSATSGDRHRGRGGLAHRADGAAQWRDVGDRGSGLRRFVCLQDILHRRHRGAALIGMAGARWAPRVFAARGAEETENPPCAMESLDHGRTLRIAATCLVLWWTPVLAAACLWRETIFASLGMFFSKAALVTFGGAYAVLPFVAQQAVEHYQWLSASQMVTGLGLAETTPGPLILVLEFVGSWPRGSIRAACRHSWPEPSAQR